MLSVLPFGRMREKGEHVKLHGRRNKFRSQYGGEVDDTVVILYKGACIQGLYALYIFDVV